MDEEIPPQKTVDVDFILLNRAKKIIQDAAELVENFEEQRGGNNDNNGDTGTLLIQLRSILQLSSDFMPSDLFQKSNRRLNLVRSVMSNGLLIRHILSYLERSKDLKSFRLVNRQWEKEATAVLLRKPPMQKQRQRQQPLAVRIVWSTLAKRYEHSQKLGSLAFFHENIFRSYPQHKFPCPRFQFIGGDLSSPDARAFLINHGHCIHELALSLEMWDVGMIKMVLREWVPNLTMLNLVSIPSSPLSVHPGHVTLEQDADQENVKMTSKNPSFPKLPNLKVLVLPYYDQFKERSFQDFAPIVAQILSAGPNLKEVRANGKIYQASSVSIYWVREFLAAERLDLIRTLDLVVTPGNLDHLHLFCRGKQPPTLMNLSLRFSFEIWRHPPATLSSLVSALLDLNKETLQELDGLGSVVEIGDSHGLKPIPIPVMPKVAVLNVGHDLNRLPSSPQQKLPEIFPNLKILRLGDSRQNFVRDASEIFIHANSCQTLEELYIPANAMNYTAPLNLEKTAKIFPNLKRLNIEIEMDQLGNNFIISCRAIWMSFSNLEKLIINCIFPHNEEMDPGLPGECDAAVTGVDADTCREMGDSLELKKNLAAFKAEEFTRRYLADHRHRIQPNIKNLRCLREFGIQSRMKRIFFSNFAILYTFKPLCIRVFINAQLLAAS